MQVSENVEQVRSWDVQFLSIDAAQAFFKKVKDDVRLFGVNVHQANVRFHTLEQKIGRELATEFETEWTKLEAEKNPAPQKDAPKQKLPYNPSPDEVMRKQTFVGQEPSEKPDTNAVQEEVKNEEPRFQEGSNQENATEEPVKQDAPAQAEVEQNSGTEKVEHSIEVVTNNNGEKPIVKEDGQVIN